MSIWVKFSKKFRFSLNFRKSWILVKFLINFRKISILVKIFEKFRFFRKFGKISILQIFEKITILDKIGENF